MNYRLTNIRMLRCQLLATLSALILVWPTIASADIRTWDFAVVLDEGTGLPTGTVLAGSVSLDDSGLPLGSPGVSQTGLLTDVDFSFNGIDYDETTANTGFLQFNADGSLDFLSFGSNCSAGGCFAANSNDWFLSIGSFRVGETNPTDFDFVGVITPLNQVKGDMTFAERLSPTDPDTLLEELEGIVTGVGPGRSLADKIMLAQVYLAVPDVQSTCAMLSAFQNQVRAQRGKKLSAVLADQLTVDAQAVIDAIGCD